MTRRQVGVPGVIVETLRAERLVRTHVAQLRIEQRHRVREAIHAEHARDAKQRHTAAELHAAHACALGRFHRRGIVVLFGEPPFALGAVVCFRDVLQHSRGDLRAFILRNPQPLVAPAVVVFARRQAVALAREAGVVPLFESLADHAAHHAAIAVEAARQRESLLAHARIPAMRHFVAEQVCRFAVLHRRSDADHHAVAHIRVEDAVVRIVRRAGERVDRVVLPEVAIDLLPAAVRIRRQRILDRLLQAPRGSGGRHQSAEPGCAQKPEKIAAIDLAVHDLPPPWRDLRYVTTDSMSDLVSVGRTGEGSVNAAIPVPRRPRLIVSTR